MSNDWIEVNIPFWHTRGGTDFVSLDLNKAGTLIDTEKGIFLIGHINQVGGICDDCSDFDDDTIVKRYKIVWEEEL